MTGHLDGLLVCDLEQNISFHGVPRFCWHVSTSVLAVWLIHPLRERANDRTASVRRALTRQWVGADEALSTVLCGSGRTTQRGRMALPAPPAPSDDESGQHRRLGETPGCCHDEDHNFISVCLLINNLLSRVNVTTPEALLRTTRARIPRPRALEDYPRTRSCRTQGALCRSRGEACDDVHRDEARDQSSMPCGYGRYLRPRPCPSARSDPRATNCSRSRQGRHAGHARQLSIAFVRDGSMLLHGA